jgi:hypothetical protein
VKHAGKPEELVGEELSAVSFVRDYVELHFDGPIIRALTPIRVGEKGTVGVSSTEHGWRDQLCAQIGKSVREVVIDDVRAIVIRFEDGTELIIPLDTESRSGPEAAHFVPFPRTTLSIW